MKLTILLTSMLIPICAFAQGTSVGDANLRFLFPARVLGMAGASVADPNNASNSFLNPASLASGSSPEIMFSQLQWIQDIQTQMISTSLPLAVGTAALAISSTSVSDIQIRDIPGPPIGTFNAHSTVFQLGYAFPILSDLMVGTSLKYLYDKIYVDEATGYAIDLGGLYTTPVEGLTLGASLTNVGKMNKFRTQASDLPSNLDIGANYAFKLDDFDVSTAAAFGRQTVTGANAIHVGAEAEYSKLFAIRLGYQTGYDLRGMSAGLGIHYSIVHLDYAFVPFSSGFGDAHIITLAVRL
jgi:hypothetical protein